MKLKMKLMAAAIALVASAGANAAMTNFASGDSSLAFIALDTTGSPISMMMDLDYSLNSFLPVAMSAPGIKIEWNFNANTLKVNNAVQGAAQTNWSGAMSTFAGVAQAADTKWAVIGGDSSTTGIPGEVRYLTTSNSTLTTLQSQTKANLAGFSGVDSLVNANNLLQTTSNGSTASAGAAYVGDGAAFGTPGKWENKFAGVAWANEGVSNHNAFWMLDTNNGTSATKALVTGYGGDFTYAAGVLTYQTAPIPEPETYALLLAGLGMLGFMGRRRLNNRD
jgi:hypothetical protein